MTKKKRRWKSWISRIILIVFILGIIWVINLIWFRPFSINHFYDKIFVELVLEDPELTTKLGFPVVYDLSKDDLTDISDEKQWETFNKMEDAYETLKSYDFEDQSEANKLNTRILSYYLEGELAREPFFYHDYPVNQSNGIQSSLPNLMENSHRIEGEGDAEAYIERLSKFGIKFNQLIENLKIREEKGIMLPEFIIDRVLDQIKRFVGDGEAESNILYVNLENKLDKLDGISNEEKKELKSAVQKEIETTVFGAYHKLTDYLEKQKKRANNDAGVWKLPEGDAYYRYLLKNYTTTNLGPEEIHQLGLSEVARIKKEMRDILNSEGYSDTTKTVGSIVQQLNEEQRFLFPDGEEGRQMILDEYESILSEIETEIDDAFDLRPKTEVEIRRVPEFREEGAHAASYEGPAMDGSRGGIFYVNLRDVKETPKFEMKTLAYHEGIPGHHFQVAIQSELQDVPMFRNIDLFTSFLEGWALYAEQLAWELGYYEDDPFGNLGRLQAEMLRAVRLVVDTGIHSKKWTREEAIDYMVENTGMPRAEVASEIERYVVWPGQACTYKIGMMKILELRERAKKELGEDFELAEFHNAVLRNGALPLDILEEIIDEYIEEKLREEKVS